MCVFMCKYYFLISSGTWRLFMVHGANEDESHLTEVLCSTTQLRSRTSFVLLNSENGTVYIWHGKKSSDTIKQVTKILCCLFNLIFFI